MRVLVKDVMSKGVVKLKKTQTIQEVNQLFLDRVIDGAPVVDDNGRVIGVFTKTHLMRAVGKPLDTTIEWLMNKNVMTISETMPVEEAMNIPVGRLPVVDKQGRMVGWLTRTDLASAFLDHYKKAIEGLLLVIDSAAYGLIAIDETGKITVFNKVAEHLWGVDAGEILGSQVSEIFPVMKMANLLKTGEPNSYKLQVNGEIFQVNTKPMIKNGQIVGAVAQFYKSEDE
ncbi:MAG TPA: CBS domain-containing protein [Desulfobacteria bacterium]|nr:CBS domain-containing protein [Desulfobacteria bacterium]